MDKTGNQYTGTWIPAHIMLDKRLKMVDRALYAEIASFVDCFASNEFFAERLDISVRQIQRALARLKELGYVADVSFDGRNRHMTAIYNQTRQKQHVSHDKNDIADVSDLSPIDNSIEHKENTVAITRRKSAMTEKTPEEADLYRSWSEAFGFEAKTTSAERRAVHKLLKEYPVERIRVCIQVAAAGRTEKYCPVITSFVKLEEKWRNMEAYIARKVTDQNKQSGRVVDLSNMR